MTKDILRQTMKEKRRAITPSFRKTASRRITDTVLELCKSSECVMIYMSAFKEPDTHELLKKLTELNLRVCVPVSDTNTFTITPALISSVTDIKKGAYGIYEPTDVVPVNISDIDIAFIPGIAFSKSGDRLGFGKGYYDRFLSEFHGTKAGICYDFQVLDEIPASEHDVKMDLIITETRTYNDF